MKKRSLFLLVLFCLFSLIGCSKNNINDKNKWDCSVVVAEAMEYVDLLERM